MMVLLSGAGLLLESFQAVLQVGPGFDAGVLTVRLSLPRKDYAETASVSRFYEELEARVAALPGVVRVAAVNHVPLNGALASADYKVADRRRSRTTSCRPRSTAWSRRATSRRWASRSSPAGVRRRDREGRPAVAVVSQALARQSFPDGDPVGQHLLVKDTPGGFRPIEIVGVVGDVKHASLEAAAAPHLYVPYHQTHPNLLVWLAQNQFLLVRAAGDPLALARPCAASPGGRPERGLGRTAARRSFVDAAAASRRFSLVLLRSSPPSPWRWRR